MKMTFLIAKYITKILPYFKNH